ncbi:MAG TPA: hypothetical protein VFY10_05790 [Dehalococcoidia bacterium]|nr:hypothetical protein [Dehalococcoidia bacterium]
MLFLFLLPLGYGWGYRRWGPPRPYYMRRSQTAAYGWSWLADLVWVVFLVLLIWFLIAVLV